MKKIIYALILSLVVVSGLVFANLNTKNEKLIPKPLSATERETARKNWEATADGVKYKKWKASPEGKKVLASTAKLDKHLKGYTDMEAVITSLSLPKGALLGFGIMVKINNEDYMLCFRPEETSSNFLPYNDEFRELYSLKVNDKIIIRSRGISHAPKYSYPILWADYVKLGSKLIYKHIANEDRC